MAILKEKVGLTNADMRKLRSMRPGMPLDLQVKSPTSTKRVRTEFVGRDGMKCLILKFPDESRWGNLRDAIYPDNNLVVRYILEDETGEIIAFKVKVTLVLSKPGNYVFTTFPLSIQSHGLRAEQRAQTQIKATVLNEQGDKELADGVILDLSSSGCRVGIKRTVQKERFAAKTPIRVKIRLPDGSDEILAGTIMNAKQDEVENYYGVKFEASAPVVESMLSQFLLV
ncbi:flagellar brake protein [Aestuariibacter halophilus]|uniref:Flagellar brake protein n=1 Tax=Fluctibacter halophilus TaxID=226011 RepID=A0ABS8G5N8_9ALTE|nr:PilZ domain-containing protein [Aestuariibacter halophilus]MCC2615823.1 flagellar brake protein [Aestuariibacter halophilus]